MKKVLFALPIIIFFIACQTSIPVEVIKASEINMSHMRNIAVLDFSVPAQGMENIQGDELLRWQLDLARQKNGNYNAEQEEVGRYATNELIGRLKDTNYFKISGPDAVRAALLENTPGHTGRKELGKILGVDAFIMPVITYMNINLNSIENITKDMKGNPYIDHFFTKDATLRIRLEIINVADGRSTIIPELRGYKTESESLYFNLSTNQAMYREILDRVLRSATEKLAPYKIMIYRSLMTDETKNPLMPGLDKLVREKAYAAALEGYLSIWKETNNPAAGYNAAILLEATGDLDGAIALMAEVADTTKLKRAIEELDLLKKTKQEAAAVLE